MIPFTGVQEEAAVAYWRYTTDSRNVANAWMVTLDFGFVYSTSKRNQHFVLPVRVGP